MRTAWQAGMGLSGMRSPGRAARRAELPRRGPRQCLHQAMPGELAEAVCQTAWPRHLRRLRWRGRPSWVSCHLACPGSPFPLARNLRTCKAAVKHLA